MPLRVLLTGICGFVGSTLVETWKAGDSTIEITGIDNLIRPGSEVNRERLRRLGVSVSHGDIRSQADFDSLPAVDWVVDAAANPSVLAGVDGKTSSRQLVEHNLLGTINILEYCRRVGAGFILLSTSRVYSINELRRIQLTSSGSAFSPLPGQTIAGLSASGAERAVFYDHPLSLYGATKLASEQLALEYGDTFGFPVWIDRCGVLAGAGQFGRADQGIFSFWIHSWARRRRLGYIGFNGLGHQVRDCLHPRDLAPLLLTQMSTDSRGRRQVADFSGGIDSACSLAECSAWCAERFGPHAVAALAEDRAFDIPWIVLDSHAARDEWGWTPVTPKLQIFEEIARHADTHPNWLELSSG